MNILKILTNIEKVDPEIFDRLDSRRHVFKHMAGLGQKLSAAALPLAFGAILNKAYGQVPNLDVVGVLNFALKLEYLESYFYDAGLGIAGQTASVAQTALRAQFSATNLSALDIIKTDEANHVRFLTTAINAAQAGAAISAPTRSTFDFTGGKGGAPGPFADVFVNPATFLAVAQSLEDTGVRAYKGGAPLLMTNKDVLTAALNIHSVEARHASRLRTMRRGGAANNQASAAAINGTAETDRRASPKSWISGQDGGGASPTQTAPIYAAGNATGAPAGVFFPNESNTNHGGSTATNGVDLTTNTPGFPALSYSEAFDEALDPTTVSTIARTFVITGSTFI